MTGLPAGVAAGVTDNVDFDFSGLDEMNHGVIREFRETGGTAGGLVEGKPLVLLHHTGAKSGTVRVAPLVPLVEGGRVYVFASLGGADIHPAWFHNLLAHPDTVVELGDETVAVRARVLTGDERDAIYAKQSVRHPEFADYQRKTARVIPVVELVRQDAGMTPQVIQRWIDYIDHHDPAVLEELLAEDAVFYSPAVFTPQRGKATTAKYLNAAAKLFGGTDFHYVEQWYSENSAILEFQATLDGVVVDGIDMIHWGEDGKIVSFKVMIRPFKGLQAVIPRMAELLGGQ